MSLKGADGRYLWANDCLISVLGRSPVGLGDADLFSAEIALGMRERDAEALRGGCSVRSEDLYQLPGGDRVFLVERIPLDSQMLATISVEITQRSRTEEDILASRALFKGILDIAADAVVSVDESQRIVLFNQGAERIFGYSAADAIGQPLEMLLPPPSRQGHSGHVAHFRHSPEASRKMGERGLIAGRRANGEIFPAEASISRVEVGGRPTFTAILRDVTVQKEAEAAIRALNADLSRRALQLEAANRELEAFSYSVSHDLRSPLRAIDGFSQVLIEDYAAALPKGAQDALDRVRAATQRMGQLIDDMLDLSRLTRGDIHRSHVDLSAIAKAIAEDLRKSQPERDVRVTVADGMETEADPHLLQVLMGNLLDNAWKYTSKHASAQIEVGRVEAAGHRPAFYVKDDGAGFDMAYAHKLFGAFQRLHGMAEYPGTGIGLATVQRIVHKHGGEIWALGAVEQGATFTFTLE